MKVDISSHFKSGNLQTPYFVDLPFLNDETKRLIADFIADVIEGKPLEGINKPSWVNRNYDELETAGEYKTYNCWHYHIGPHIGKTTSLQIPLKLNLSGSASSAILHYQKISEDHICILAYSPKHIPFPRFNQTNNPIMNRLR
ncbi:hypothetical protein [Actinobacillus equuli]|uniref:hypothetical protein n=1 Tax=Actinobacillus equuli TaxID=718 RepID=UPI002442740D|nr:hypothetical protein [Actinobacillus equuli]WGE47219.1 hypothetical protein NYR84_03225 [Actinobacillus equuli subsp. haemolyticus]